MGADTRLTPGSTWLAASHVPSSDKQRTLACFAVRACDAARWPLASVGKVKAHQEREAVYASEDAAAILQYEANFSVDLEAKAAVTLHALPDGDIAAFNAQSRRWFKVISAFFTILPLFQTPRAQHGKLVRAHGGTPNCIGEASLNTKHDYVWFGTKWRCLGCWRSKLKPRSPIDRTPCGGLNPTLSKLLEGPSTHKLWCSQLSKSKSLFLPKMWRLRRQPCS